jgi:ElaB/YqjD/DUF883 family membrane-anchored ribosome-binding protein
MENEPEVIRQEMQQTRNSLTEKLEALEQHVLGTVQSATSAVHETVSSVKGAVEDTVTSVKSSIDETMSTVKSSIGGTVDTVKETFDLELQVQRHPWLMVGGSVGAGYLGGKVMQRLIEPPRSHYLPGPGSPVPTHLAEAAWSERPPSSLAPPAQRAVAEAPRQPTETWTDSLLTTFEPEIQRLKGMAIGAVFNVVKGLMRRYVPPTVEPQVEEMLDSVTRKMGGKPLQGSIMDELRRQHA